MSYTTLAASVFRVFLFEGVTPRSYQRRVDVPGSNAHWMRVYRPEATHWLSGCNVNLSSVCSRTYVDRLRGVSLVRWILCTVSVGLVWSASSFCSCSSSSSCWFLLSRTWTQVRHDGPSVEFQGRNGRPHGGEVGELLMSPNPALSLAAAQVAMRCS